MKYTVSLNKNREFQRLYNRGKRNVSPYFALYYRKNGSRVSRLGITTGTKLGGAVVRNKVRRRIREIYRLAEPGISPGWDIIIVARSKTVTGGFWEQKHDLFRLLSTGGLLSKPSPSADVSSSDVSSSDGASAFTDTGDA